MNTELNRQGLLNTQPSAFSCWVQASDLLAIFI